MPSSKDLKAEKIDFTESINLTTNTTYSKRNDAQFKENTECVTYRELNEACPPRLIIVIRIVAECVGRGDIQRLVIARVEVLSREECRRYGERERERERLYV